MGVGWGGGGGPVIDPYTYSWWAEIKIRKLRLNSMVF